MQLSQQEILFLDRMAHHMVATGDMDIERAGRAVLARDKELLQVCIQRKEEIAKPICNSAYRKVDSKNRRRPEKEISGNKVMLLAGQFDPSKLRYEVNGKPVYISRKEVALHMRGLCKPGCLRCYIQDVIDQEA